ncbi:uncharacterized protein LOC129321728 [Prosopis cineraria]|uniref:uncharacterized protein LOC129321728 n=1 Tax=Prosopis cineraria TaxID=364024 RepID=UPI00240F5BBC|nr:uncharacterized protein LOC129321728 [Prosopis cineraria]
MASVQCQKHNEICQKQSHHTKLGQKICEMTNKAFKGHGNTNTNTSSKAETHCYTQTQTSQNVTDQSEAKTETEITLLVVQARITQTNTNHPPANPRGTTTTCFGNHTWKNQNNKKDMTLFRRIKDGVSRHNNCDNDSSSDSDSDKENCRKRKN